MELNTKEFPLKALYCEYQCSSLDKYISQKTFSMFQYRHLYSEFQCPTYN